MKRMITKIMGCCLPMALLLSGCGGADAAQTTNVTEHTETTHVIETTAVHEHVAKDGWEWNGVDHWHICACGEVFDETKHSVGDDMLCSVCQVEIWDVGGGYVDANSRDAYGNSVRSVSYDPDGNILSEHIYEYEYDDEGNKQTERFYVDGKLQDDNKYEMNSDGEIYLAISTIHQEDGTHYYYEYNENGDLVKAIGYDPDGNVTSESYYEYAINEDGESYESKEISISDGETSTYEYNSYGDIVHRICINEDGDVTSEDVWEYEYNEDGNVMWQKWYRQGILVYEIVDYAEVTTDDYSMRYPETIIEYNEDGTKLVLEHGNNSEVSLETLYASDGSVIYELNYVYEVDEEGNWSNIKVYKNGNLMIDKEYAVHSEYGWSYLAKMTEYMDDGTKTVSEYDENEELVKETRYDADGKEIS